MICEASVPVLGKFKGTNTSTEELNNFIDEMFLFHKDNLHIVSISGNKQVFKVTLSLDITSSQDAEQFIQGYCDHNNEAIKVSCARYDVYYPHKPRRDHFTKSSKIGF